MINQLRKDLKGLATPERAKASAWYFKTGPGQYGEGDKFIGLTVPQMRTVSKKYKDLRIGEIATLLHSPIHEERAVALLILAGQLKKADEEGKKKIVDFYLANTQYVNNWDLVDSSAGYILGEYLLDKPKGTLYKLARSCSLWERRISIIATSAFIARGESAETLKIAELLLGDKHDLIHKAVGWMLREVGKRIDERILTGFLDKQAATMPRTTLRYALERLTPEQRSHYMKLRPPRKSPGVN
jgi:3-methyladenine DNA glycosylase AlkD